MTEPGSHTSPKERKRPVLKIRAEITLDADITLAQVTEAASEIRTRLEKLGEGDVNVSLPRGTYNV